MTQEYLPILLRLLGALIAGALIGFERTYHGRPAGFRTHILVCIASSLLMLLAAYQVQLFPGIPRETVRIDPTRMAQGIMTGIGFLGAGVIMKAGLSIRGLTTAASIWITASIGILIGVGFYMPAVGATLLTLITLSVFRWIEPTMPSLSYAYLRTRFPRKEYLPEVELLALMEHHGISSSNSSYHVIENGKFFEYRMTIRTWRATDFKHLADTLARMDAVLEFEITPAGNEK